MRETGDYQRNLARKDREEEKKYIEKTKKVI